MTAKELTVEEKLRLICGKDMWHTEDFGGKLPFVSMSDGPVGVRKVVSMREDGWQVAAPSIAYPSIQTLANTWSEDCAREMGESLASDCLDAEVDILLAPGMNVKRHPMNGRNFEYFSEDPYLAGTLARSYVASLQEGGVGACIKHFCANNLEYNRLHQSSEVDERSLRELYYKPFEIASQAKPVSLMCSYNRVNGVYASEYKKGFDVLRDEFGFDGAIISDWGAVRDRTAAAKAGLDLEMPFTQATYDRLVEDYKKGLLSDETLDRCAQRVLDLVARCKEMRKDKTPKKTKEERLQAARRIAAEGIVLLKNDGTLPLQRGTSVSVCGCYAVPTEGMVSGGGSARVTWSGKTWNLPELLSERLGTKAKYEAAFMPRDIESFSQDPARAVENAAACEVNVVCVGTGDAVEYESGDRASLELPEVQVRAILETAAENPNTVVVLFAGSAVDVSAWEHAVSAIVYAGFPGEQGGAALADILTGVVNPSGKLSETFPMSEEDVPSVNAYRDAQVSLYEEGLNVGYRYFVTHGVPTKYPFGYGLSYSSFVYHNLVVTEEKDGLMISYELENASERCGKEISQIYVRPIAPRVYRPAWELKGYAKTELKANEKKKVSAKLVLSDFAYYSVAENRWKADDGFYEIYVGASSEDIRLTQKVRIKDGKLLAEI